MKKQNGITLIALIITIIVMLTLVGVTVSVALNGGLFTTAKEAAKGTETERNKEIALSGEEVEIDGIVYASMEDYLNNNPKLPDDWTVATDEERVAAWPTETVKNENVTAIKEQTTNKIIPLPKGFQVSLVEGENTIEKGVVIKDSKGNEFVWIPVSQDLEKQYNYSSSYLEPKELDSRWNSSTLDPKPEYDSQKILTELYGMKDESTPFYNYTTDFAYSTHYKEMVASVNKYDGFYIGRYETTIDKNNEIGTKADTTVLTADKSIPQTNDKKTRWYGLYNTQRNSNVIGNNDYIQTNMIWGQQWDKMIEYFASRKINYSEWGKSTQGAVVKSAESTNASGKKDEIYNIYDLRTNGRDWTAEADNTFMRVTRGGHYDDGYYAACRNVYLYSYYPTNTISYYCSRFTLYIK